MEDKEYDFTLDYEQTNLYFRMLAEIRFKLLALVPIVSGVGIYFATQVSAGTELTLSFVGFLATLGIIIYELRNTQIYDRARKRLQVMEEERLGFIKMSGQGRGGIHSEHPRVDLKIFRWIKIKHDYGLSAIYGAALGGWGYLIFHSIFRSIFNANNLEWLIEYIPLLPALSVTTIVIFEFIRIDKLNRERIEENEAKQKGGN